MIIFVLGLICGLWVYKIFIDQPLEGFPKVGNMEVLNYLTEKKTQKGENNDCIY